jgi:hypothetical protein
MPARHSGPGPYLGTARAVPLQRCRGSVTPYNYHGCVGGPGTESTQSSTHVAGGKPGPHVLVDKLPLLIYQ